MAYPYETATEEQRRIGAWWWNVHHELQCEPLAEPVQIRVSYMVATKPASEIETRLRELRPVLHPERLPKDLIEARAAFDKARLDYVDVEKAYIQAEEAHAEVEEAWADCQRIWAEGEKTWAVYVKALHEHEPELTALHREEYPDTQWTGTSIFKETR